MNVATTAATLDIAARHGPRLLTCARDSIRRGLEYRQAPEVSLGDFPVALHEPRASFVTLTIAGRLRGCIGSLEATRPLVTDVAHNAYGAAFSDPRFPALTTAELPRLEFHISVLSPPQPLQFASEQELLAQLRPGIDGLILEEHGRRGTFLPSVWEQLAQPAEFLQQLKRKTGLPADYWSPTLRVRRYTCALIS